LSDVESISYIRVKLASVRGFIGAKIYASVMDNLNIVKGELDHLKTVVGQLTAANEGLSSDLIACKNENDMIRAELAAKSIEKADATIIETVKEVIGEKTDCGTVPGTVCDTIDKIESQ
jgi:hypothetical protein